LRTFDLGRSRHVVLVLAWIRPFRSKSGTFDSNIGHVEEWFHGATKEAADKAAVIMYEMSGTKGQGKSV
jgi:hypothetical protein